MPVEHLVILRPEEAVSFLMEEEEPLMSLGPVSWAQGALLR